MHTRCFWCTVISKLLCVYAFFCYFLEPRLSGVSACVVIHDIVKVVFEPKQLKGELLRNDVMRWNLDGQLSIESEEILEIAEAAISAIFDKCRDVNVCDCPRISDYTHQLIYTFLHINWKWLNDKMEMFTPETRQTDSNTVILTEPLWNNMLLMLLVLGLNDVLVTRN